MDFPGRRFRLLITTAAIVASIAQAASVSGKMPATSEGVAQVDATPAVTADWQAPTQVWVSNGGEDEIRRAAALAINPCGTIWVNDASNRFHLLDLEGNLVTIWGSEGTGPGEFDFAFTDGEIWGGVVFATDGEILVLDSANGRVQVFNMNFEYTGEWGGTRDGPESLVYPVAIALNPAGEILILDGKRDVVEAFDRNGTVLRNFPIHAQFGIEAYDRTTSNAMAVDSEGNIYIASLSRTSILKFDAEGKLLAEIGSAGTGDGQFGQPTGISIDTHGTMYVTDYDFDRVLAFDREGKYLRRWSVSDGSGDQVGPVGIVARHDSVYVSAYNGTVTKFHVGDGEDAAMPQTSDPNCLPV